MSSPTHHRAIALVLTVLLALGLTHRARRDAPPAAVHPVVVPDASPVDPNTADAVALQRLPGIGPVLARRIVAARAAGVRFERAEDLRRVRGIGPSHVARIAARLWFATDPPSSGRPPRR